MISNELKFQGIPNRRVVVLSLCPTRDHHAIIETKNRLILHAARSETSSNSWKLSVISEASLFGVGRRHTIQDVLYGGSEVREGRVITTIGRLPLHEPPQALDQIQVRRVRRQE